MGHGRRGRSITLLPFICGTGAHLLNLGVTVAIFAMVEPEFELSTALRGRKPHSLS